VLLEVAPSLHRFSEANDRQWKRFARKLATQGVGEISDSGRMGIFGIGARRLKDLGLMTDVKKVKLEDKSVYMGTFVPPMSMERFLCSPKPQYNVFRKSMLDYHKAIVDSGLSKLIGKEIGIEALTMSGLLGLASQAGIKGAKSWLEKPQERERFPHTTQTFLETNGIF
jgi:hypothetical protein